MILKFGNYIKSLRKRLNMSQFELGAYLHCSFQAVSRYESNKVDIDLSFLSILARVLKVDLTSFINMKDEKNNDDCDHYVFNADKFAFALIYLRTMKHLSQKEMSKEIGISNNKISKWENGTSLPTIFEFIKLKEFFGVTYEDLYFAKFDIQEVKSSQYKKKKVFVLAYNEN